MSICEYCEKGTYYGVCTCTKSQEMCPFMRRCSIEHDWVPLDSMNKCTLREPERRVELKQGEYIVRIEKNGDLYIEVEDYVIVKKNPFDDIPEKVELVKVDNEMYIKGFEPKKEKEVKEEPKKKKTK